MQGFFAAMKIADVPVENKRVTEAQAIFMQSGGPKAHDIFAQNDMREEFFSNLLR